ncbi:MAG: plasmid stabilization system protein [Leeuwenhoekiella sp.]|nr:MAG: plasmid stabilization system protein [Leeuwenhoekiella sp.]
MQELIGRNSSRVCIQSMEYKLIVKPEAEQDLVEALEWLYENSNVAPDFLQEVDESLQRILKNPYNFQKKYREIRVVYTKRFRYGIHYLIEDTTIFILAFLHTSRRPRE